MTTDAQMISNLAVPPGEYLEEVLEELGISKGELATRMGRPQAKLSAIFNGTKAITPDTALQLERVTGVKAHIWTGLENEYRLSLARQKAEEREEACKAEVPLVTRFCYRELVKQKLVAEFSRGVDRVRALQEFFGVMSLESVCEVPRYQVAWRHGARRDDDRSPEALAAWLRVGEVRARDMSCEVFDERRLRESLGELRRLSRMDLTRVRPRLRETLAGAGVALVICPHFPKTQAQGATFFLTREKAVMMLTLRYAWADIFWFTLFHEIGHLLLHSRGDVIVEGLARGDKEDEADAFARDQLIPPGDWEAFVGAGAFTRTRIEALASDRGIAPGIVVGRLQHEERIPKVAHNSLRRRYRFAAS